MAKASGIRKEEEREQRVDTCHGEKLERPLIPSPGVHQTRRSPALEYMVETGLVAPDARVD